MLGKLWEQLEHQISTVFWVSDISYTSTVERLLYWIGQGSCSSPILWALLNQSILKALDEKYDCITLVSEDKLTTSKRPVESFVDNITAGTTNDEVTKEPIQIGEK
jgi:hypothetical protein